jgi:hypothetical protein
MSNFLPKARPAERNAFCRACDKPIVKGEHMITWYSQRNQGMSIHLHEECAINIGTMAMTTKGKRENV